MAEYVSIKEEVLRKLAENLAVIQEQFGIETLGIFGSVSRGEDTEASDVDVLYRFRKGRGGMHDLVGLYEFLKELFGRDVDVISFDYISPLIEAKVRADSIVISSGVLA